MVPPLRNRDRLAVLKIVGIYALVGGLWIYLSDTLLLMAVRTPEGIARISVFKGLFFIVLTSVLLYKLIRRYADQSAASRQLVVEKARQLEEANRELEAFNYSLSHDLRTYITRIGAAAHVLEESRSDSPHTGYCTRIIEEACRGMEDLIASMLRLSLISRSELSRERVNLSAMVGEITGDLLAEEPDREVAFVLEPDLYADCDRHLMKIALENLFKNAWKYSSSVVPARIEFGRVAMDGGAAFFVRDNGPGFDMDEADKLFKPFQRLNNAKDVLGSGIGLATVQRIIQRHDGKVWGAGEIDRGATFYFMLP